MNMKKFTSLLIGCSLALAGVAFAQQPENEDDNKNGSEQTVRSVTESITAGRERSDQEQDENDKNN